MTRFSLIHKDDQPADDLTAFSDSADSLLENPLSEEDIAAVMRLDKLQQVLSQAEAFLQVNSESLDDF